MTVPGPAVGSAALRIAVVGCGAMGSVYAARLADAGNDVLVLDRGAERIDAIRTRGLELRGPDRRFVVQVRAAVHAPEEPMDLVVIAVKAADAAGAARSAGPLIGSATVVLTVQNGLGSAERVAAVVGADRLAVGVASGFGAAVVAPGIAEHRAMRAVLLGAHAGLPVDRLEFVARAWRAAGFSVEVTRDLAAVQWEKLMCNAAYSAQCALTGLTVGQVLENPATAAVAAATALEVAAVSAALGISTGVVDPEGRVRDFAAAMPSAKPSALLDHELHRVSEIDAINGEVARLGRSVGVPTPVNDLLVTLVAAKEQTFVDSRTGPEFGRHGGQRPASATASATASEETTP
jgi:2-dehydropantoate 2-reductase